ncbi:TetR family transcriptional regulator [Rhodoblastus acidophilus]|uniref:TetR family transcriptional regulator n=2 Tax=Rhodoblastus acidophilus TaxID=1074 RepID=A0A6N8DPS0_RHOAC|nr:TetR family transcriptional regulator [Rhodoblastus acidophilus]
MSMTTAAQSQILRAALKLFGERGATQVNVKELAEAAGVARGTIYNNLDDLAGLFDAVAVQLAAQMSAQVEQAIAGLDEPAQRLATGIRLHVLYAARDPAVGRFILRFGFSAAALREIWTGQALADLRDGRARGFYDFPEAQLDAVVNFISGATIGVIASTLERPERAAEAGMEAAERILIALGLTRAEARRRARAATPE